MSRNTWNVWIPLLAVPTTVPKVVEAPLGSIIQSNFLPSGKMPTFFSERQSLLGTQEGSGDGVGWDVEAGDIILEFGGF